MDRKLIVITGAAGFIGSGVVRHLNDKGFSNLLLVDDVKKSEKWKNLVQKKFADFISKHQLFSWLEGRESEIGAFIHLGACSDTMETDGDYLMENNTRYTIRLASYALEAGTRFIYASSAATYGNGERGFSDDHEGLDALEPLNLYGYSKHLFDLWAKRQGVLTQIAGLKYFNVFGPNEHHKGHMASMIYKMLPIALQQGEICLFKSNDPGRFADGAQQRDHVYIKDVARITAEFLDNGLNGIYNVGRGEAVTWNEVAHAVFKGIEKPARIRYIDMPEALHKQYQNYTCADMRKLSPHYHYAVEGGVIDYIQNHLLRDERW